MANVKITELPTSDDLAGGHILVTRPEPDGNGGEQEAVRRVPVSAVATPEYVDQAIAALRTELTYEPISGTVRVEPDVAEAGSTINMRVIWELSKVPASLTVGDEEISELTASGSCTISGACDPASVTVVATDEQDVVYSRTVGTRFVPYTYAGGISGVTSAEKIVQMAERRLRTGAPGTYEIRLQAGDSICLATPYGGSRRFTINNFPYDATVEEVDITNRNNVTTHYYVYRIGSDLDAGTLQLVVA